MSKALLKEFMVPRTLQKQMGMCPNSGQDLRGNQPREDKGRESQKES